MLHFALMLRSFSGVSAHSVVTKTRTAATNQKAGILLSFIIYSPRFFLNLKTSENTIQHIFHSMQQVMLKVAKDGAYSLTSQKTRQDKMHSVSPINMAAIILQNSLISQIM